MKIVIAGMGDIGLQLSQQLTQEDHDIIAIDNDESRLEYIESLSEVLSISGSATLPSVLNDAGAGSADLFIAVTSVEETNITAALLAKKMGAKRVVARVANEEYVSKDCDVDFKELGIDYLIYPEELTSIEIVKLIKRAAATDVIEFEDGKLSLMGLKLEPDSPIIGKTLQELASDYADFDFRTVAIQRGFKTIIPKGQDKFQKNDQVFVITTSESVDKTLELTGKKKQSFENLMILGGGKIGRMTARSLENEFKIKLIESDKEKTRKIADTLSDTLVLHGDGRDIDLLAQEGIIDMDAYIAVTEDSETNIISCLMAKHLGVKKSIALVDNVDYIPMAQTIGLDSLINKKLIAVNDILRSARKSSVVTIANLHGIDAEVFELITNENSKITKKPIKDVGFPKDALLGGIIRDGKGHITVGDTQLEANDKAVVFAFPGSIEKVKKLFE